jgi:PAS domain S-box-containing protein
MDCKREELESSEARDRLLKVIDNTTDMVSMADLNGNIVYMNPAGIALLGWEPTNPATGRPIADAHPPEVFKKISEEGIPAAIENGVWQGKTSIIDADGIEIPVSQVILSHKDDNGELHYLSTIIRDMRDELAAEQEMNAVIRELKTRNLDLEQFNYAVSHDLKSPLITINGFLWKLQKDIKNNEAEKIARDIDVISDSVTKVHSLLDDMLNYSKISYKESMECDVQIPDVIDMVNRLIRGEYCDQSEKIMLHADLPVVRADKSALIEVYLNIITNAIKYQSPDRDLLLEIGSSNEDKENHILFVKDNGIGMDPAYTEKIFKMFQRLNADSLGNGIGLSIAQSIITKHGGKMWAESEGLDKGSTFFISLPKTINEAADD